MKRAFDATLAFMLLLLGAMPMGLIACAVKLTSRGPAFYGSYRLGRDNRLFRMPKFRTMRIGAPEVATHLLANPQSWITPLGAFLRITSLDELPQLWCILRGDMSFVGPRPALHNQQDLIALRTRQGVHRLTPGLTGWAQINGRDELPVSEKVRLDSFYLQHRSFWFDLRILMVTAWKVLRREGVLHSADQRARVDLDSPEVNRRAA